MRSSDGVEPQAQSPRVAIVHDWLTGMRGGERVLEGLLDIFPDASLHTLVHVPGSVSPFIEDRDIVTSFIDWLPLSHRKHQIYLPLFPLAVRGLQLEGADLVISTSHCVAKGALAPPGVPHICYCHTPMRYVWGFRDAYFAQQPRPVRFFIERILDLLQNWDVASACRVDGWITNSHNVAGRLRSYYGVDSSVIYPPVDVDRFEFMGPRRRDFYLVVSALVPYKRIDLVVQAASRLPFPLKIVGDGPERRRLESLSGSNVTFLGRLPDREVTSLMQHARAFIFPGEEDFGITPVEAQAAGTPVIALRVGGALETVTDGVTGVFFDDPTVSGLIGAIDRLEALVLDPVVLREKALEFEPGRFRSEIESFLTGFLDSGSWAISYRPGSGLVFRLGAREAVTP